MATKRKVRRPRRVNPFLARARAFWRVAAKKRNEGDQRSADWYGYQAQMAYTKYTQTRD